MKLKFSVITPAWNSVEKIPGCVQSVRAEFGRVDGEHLVQDGASTDGTVAYLADECIDFQSCPDRGMYDAINKGWSRATGDILCWLNCDEQYIEGALAKVEKIFRADPSVDIVVGDYLVVNGRGDAIAARRDIAPTLSGLRAGMMNVPTCATFYRRSLWDQGTLKLDCNFRYAADLDLVIRLAKSGARWVKVNDYLSLFMFDGTNLSCSPKMLEETDAIIDREGLSRLHRIYLKGARVLARIFSGCYSSDNVDYRFFTPNGSFSRSAKNLGWSYKQR